MENKPASLLVVPLGRHSVGFPHFRLVDRWPVTPKRARYSALIVSRDKRINNMQLNTNASVL